MFLISLRKRKFLRMFRKLETPLESICSVIRGLFWVRLITIASMYYHFEISNPVSKLSNHTWYLITFCTASMHVSEHTLSTPVTVNINCTHTSFYSTCPFIPLSVIYPSFGNQFRTHLIFTLRFQSQIQFEYPAPNCIFKCAWFE